MSNIRAIAHVHSEWSYDARWPLPRIARMARMMGCGVVLMSEHDRGFTETKWLDYREACRDSSIAGTVLIPGIEYSDPSNTVHILVWGSDHFLGEGLETTRLLEEVQRAGAVSVFAHPERRAAWQLPDLRWLNKITGIEVWNRKTDGFAPSQNAISLLKRQSVIPFVGMDFHRAKHLFPLFTRIQLTEEVTEKAVVNAIRRGECHPEALGLGLSKFESGMVFKSLAQAERSRKWLMRCFQ